MESILEKDMEKRKHQEKMKISFWGIYVFECFLLTYLFKVVIIVYLYLKVYLINLFIQSICIVVLVA